MMETNHYLFTSVFSVRISLPSRKYLMVSATAKGLLTEWFAFLPHAVCVPQLLYGGVKLQSRQGVATVEHLLYVSERHRTRTVPFRCARGTVLWQNWVHGSGAPRLKTCQWVNSVSELSSQRNFLTSEIAVCVLLSTSHPVHVTWKTACEQEITLPG